MTTNSLLLGGSGISITVGLDDLKKVVQDVVNSVLRVQEAPEQEEQYLTVKEAAEFLKVSDSTMRRWDREGYLVPSRIGKRVRYKKSELENLLK